MEQTPQGSNMFDNDFRPAIVPAECRDGQSLAGAGVGMFANLHRFFSEAASPTPILKNARSRVASRPTPGVDRRCGTGPERVRAPRDGLQTETGITADGRHA